MSHWHTAPLIVLALTGCADARSTASRPLRPPPFAEVEDQVLVTPEASIRFRDYSSGSPVILLHGYTDRLETMEGLADSLAMAHRVIALDTRGFGESTKYSDPARYGPAVLDDIIRLMDDRGISRAHVIGYSMGALLAANLAARHADRVLSATLLAGPFFADTVEARAFVQPYASEMRNGGAGFRNFLGWVFPAWNDSVLTAITDSVAAVNDRGAMIAALDGLVPLTLDRRTANTTVPVLVVAGTADPVAPYSRSLANWWPEARMLEVPGADHETVLTRLNYIDVVRAHLGSPRRTRPDRFVTEGRPDANANS
jgi:pimeloyl-ACP methyl ester carboxylesterase